MRRLLGRLLVVLVMLVSWGLRIALGAYGIYYIVTAFLDAGVAGGLIAIPVAGVCIFIAHLALSLVLIPLAGVAATLLQDE